MKLTPLCAITACAALCSAASAVVYTDPTGDMFDNGLTHLDLTSVEVTNTPTHLTFKINVDAASITSPDWGKYQIGIDTNGATGDATTPAGNPWGRLVSMSGKMDAWIGSWVDGGGGAQSWIYNAGWSQVPNSNLPVTISGNSTTMTVALADIGLAAGGIIFFDVYSTGGGADGANDALSVGTQASSNWDVPFVTQNGLTYNIVVPEPATLGLLAGASLLGLRRRK